MYVFCRGTGQAKVRASFCAEKIGKGACAVLWAYKVGSAEATGTTKFMFREVWFQEWIGSAEARAKGARDVLCRSDD